MHPQPGTSVNASASKLHSVVALPVDACLPEVTAAVAGGGVAVVVAPPGSGKSTRVPPALLDASSDGEVILLQPRRVAAIALARRIAEERGGELGAEVGYRIRFERRGSAQTRLWVQTEGMLARRLLDDPYLEGVRAIILDEFHERSLDADLCLAWCAELRRTLRPDLQLVVMSATINAEPIAQFLDDAQIITVEAGMHPVTTVQRPAQGRERIADHCVRVIDEALRAHDGDVLAFLPGVGEITSVVNAYARRDDVQAVPLHGSLPAERQADALRPGPRRRVVAATNVAETSLTVPGVRIVVDSGWARVPTLDPDTGLDELRRERISRFSAEQRAGRAGREAPGQCYRLWSALEDKRLAEAQVPALHRVDLAPLVLTLKRLHGDDLATFPWFEAPPAEQLAAAEELLVDLEFLEGVGGGLSARGQLIAELPLHPRLSRLVLEAGSNNALELGLRCAAILAEQDVLTERSRKADPGSADLLDRLAAVGQAELKNYDRSLRDKGIHGQTARRIVQAHRQLRDLTKDLGGGDGYDEAERLVPRLALAGWPDRVARRGSETANSATLVGGRGVTIDASSALYTQPSRKRSRLLVAHAVQGLRGAAGKRTVLRLGAEIDEETIFDVHPEALKVEDRVTYDIARDRVICARVSRYRDLDLRVAEGVEADAEQITACLATALRGNPSAIFAGNEAAANWLVRVRWLHTHVADPAWPAVDDEALGAVIAAACHGCRSKAEVLKQDLFGQLQGTCDYQTLQRIEQWAPERYQAPTGRRYRIRYEPQRAVLPIKVQELFGVTETPRIADGRVPLLLELLAPNQRPVQLTDDLAGFWQRTWKQVRKDLRGRYPKHKWPEDPLG